MAEHSPPKPPLGVLRCKECFYRHRRDLRLLVQPCLEQFPSRLHVQSGMVYIAWNDKTSMLETMPASMRVLPQHLLGKVVRRVTLCIPWQENCFGDGCINAHSLWECAEWNRLLGSQHVIHNSVSLTINRVQSSEYTASRSTFEERVTGDLDIKVIKEDLTCKNYKKKFHNLICWEEKRHIEILQQRCDGVYTLYLQKKSNDSNLRLGHLDGLNGDQIAYIIQASEGAFLVEPNRPAEKGRFEVKIGIVTDYQSCLDGKLSIEFLDSCDNVKAFQYVFGLKELPNKRITLKNIHVEFEVKHIYFNQLIKSVGRIDDSIVARLFPTSDDIFTSSEPSLKSAYQFFTSVNEGDQLRALQAVMSTLPCTPPTIITGSFGTGKTCLLATATQCLLEEGQRNSKPVRVLICAHHNAPSDHIINLYLGPMNAQRAGIEVIRLLSNATTAKTSFEQHIVDLKERFKFDNKPNYLAVATTFLTSHSLMWIFGKHFFTHIFLDESSQTREPEVISPLFLASDITRIVIAGDPYQVGPSLLVLGHEARSYGMKHSLLERLQKLYLKIGGNAHKYMLSLDVNFRCHKDIMCIPNQLFYGNSIVPNAQEAPPHPLAPFPLVFVCSSLTPQVNCESEVKLLLTEASKYITQKNWPAVWGPYDPQRVCISASTMIQIILANRNSSHLGRVKKLTTYAIQGQEFQALFLSTTEPVDTTGNTTNPTKSPCDPYVFNTILTRSKSLVVAAGSPLALLKIEEHMVRIYGKKAMCWSSYLKHCIVNGSFFIPASIAKCDEQEVFKAKLKSILGIEPDKLSAKLSATPPIFPPRKNVPSISPAAPNQPSKVNNVFVKIKTPPPKKIASLKVKANPAPPKRPASPKVKANPSPKKIVSTPKVKVNPSPKNIASPKVKANPAPPKKNAVSPASLKINVNPAPPKTIQPPSANDKVLAKDKANPAVSPSQSEASPPPNHANDSSTISSKLTVDNYKEKFHSLLYVEEEEHEKQLASRCSNKVFEITLGYDVKPHGLDEQRKYVMYGFISSDDKDTLAHVKQASEESVITLAKGLCIHCTHHVRAITQDICIGLQEDDAKIYLAWSKSDKKFTFKADVKFELKHTYFNRLHGAIDKLPSGVVRKLIPTSKMLDKCTHSAKKYRNGMFEHVKYPFLDLDAMQLQALNYILNSNTSVPLLVTGPFGTGKTRLLARAAYELLRRGNRRVLICAHHQASADTFMEYFGEMKNDPTNPWHYRVMRVTPNSNYYPKKYERYYTTKWDVPNHCDLIITTLGTAPSMYLKEKYFTDILIDEGAQTREPETVGPLCYADEDTRIIIAGDHCQVGPRSLVLGEEAQKNGLSVSLLERLHCLYNDLNSTSEAHSVTLQTNYRCHNGILMLPSSLYYQSTLECRVPDSIAHPLAPFPLKFVCSDLTEANVLTGGSDIEEAEVLVDTVQEYFSRWPQHWGAEDYSSICIMSPSPTQCAIIRRISRYKLPEQIKTLVTHDIQGRQFRAIFISTSELTTANGEAINQTKSICDRYIFNTVITRSQSLVVAVGNPFQLLKVEKKMIDRYGSEAQCWTPFIKQCIECNTFSLSSQLWKNPNATQTARINLFNEIYSKSEAATLPTSLDSIIEAYQKVFSSLPEFKKAKLILASSNDSSRLKWKMDDSSHNRDTDHQQYFKEKFNCVLNIENFRNAEAIPIDSKKRIVKIQGPGNRKGAFDGDVVKVGVFQGQNYGRVIEVLPRENTSHLKFICRVNPNNPIIFYPIDGKSPLLINMPRLSRDFLLKKDKVNTRDIIENHLKSNDVVVFDSLSLTTERGNGNPLPRIKQVIPVSVACNMVFLVSFVKWDPKYRNPLGMVVGAFPKGHTPFFAERLLKNVHSVDYNNEVLSVASGSDPALPVPSNNLAFTIDPEGAQNLDDALSLVKISSNEVGSEIYRLGVHIVNAAKHIPSNSEDDIVARERGTSIYGSDKHSIMHMLPFKTSYQLSLSPGKVRDVISVTCEVKIKQGVITVGKAYISPGQIRSALQLTYKEAQNIMSGSTTILPAAILTNMKNYDEHSCNLPLKKTLLLTYDIARVMSRSRLKSDAAYCYEAESDDDLLCWQARVLVGELMIWANNEVAKVTHSLYPDAAVLRSQRPPDHEELAQYIDDNISAISCSLYLSSYLEAGSLQPMHLLVPLSTLEQIDNALTSGNKVLLSSLLSSDRLYPQLSCVHSRLRSLYPRARYCCTDKNKGDVKHYEHNSLRLNEYTHFTSPLRRYADIVVQRMVLQISSSGFEHKDHAMLCCSLNKKMRNASDFERSMKCIDLAFKLTHCSKMFTAYVSQVSKGMVELTFPQFELHFFPSREKRLKLSSLGPFSRKVGPTKGQRKRASVGIYRWNARITSLQSGHAANILKTPSLLVGRETISSGNRMSLDVCKCLDASNPSATLSKEIFHARYQDQLVEIPPACWSEMIKFVKDPDQSLNNIKRYVSSNKPPPLQKNTISLDPQQAYLHLECDMAQSINKSDVIKVWLTWSMRNHVISPAVQLAELSPLLRICVQHNSHPAECFSDPDLSQASKSVYTSVNEYVELWKRVLLAEAAEKSVKECPLAIIRDVRLEWPEFVISRKCLDQHYYIPSGDVVMYLPSEFVTHCYEFFKVNVGDLVCVRYGYDSPPTSARALFHFVVHVVTSNEKTGMIRILMQSVGDSSCRVSEKIKEMLMSDPTSEVQIISLSSSYRRVFSGLLELSRCANSKEKSHFTASNLSKCIAVDHSKLLEIYSGRNGQIPVEDDFAKSISKWNSDSPRRKNVTLNERQVTAMKHAWTRSFQLIQGPPGTGKSETGAHLAYVFARHNKVLNRSQVNYKCVLYCGPSNKSVDVVLQKFHSLLRTKNRPDLRILRVYSKTIECKDYPGPSQLSYKTDYKCPKWAEEFALHHILRKRGRTNKIFSEVLRLDEMFREMRYSGSIASGTMCNHYRQTLSKAEKIILSEERFDIVFCTCNEASGSRIKSSVSPHQCIIDECGMAYEPETIVPISLCEHAVLIGDHMQLQPVIDYRPAKECGLSTSLFERYAQNYGTKYTYTLHIQYRMHKEICEFPSKYFYDGKLQTDQSVTMRSNHETQLEGFWPRGKSYPIVFINLVGEEESNQIGTVEEKNIGPGSKFNMKEAEKAIEIVRVLHTVHHVPITELAILTPYSAQKNKIQELASTSTTTAISKLKVASITESQGDEYGIVILSTVRSQPLNEIRNPHYVQADQKWLLENLGFITDAHQINVGITRSKYGLVIIGNKMLLEYDDIWKDLLKHYKKKKCIIDDIASYSFSN